MFLASATMQSLLQVAANPMVKDTWTTRQLVLPAGMQACRSKAHAFMHTMAHTDAFITFDTCVATTMHDDQLLVCTPLTRSTGCPLPGSTDAVTVQVPGGLTTLRCCVTSSAVSGSSLHARSKYQVLWSLGFLVKSWNVCNLQMCQVHV